MSDKAKYLPLSFSSLKAFDRSPLNFVHYKEGPRVESDAMRFGTMVHRAILEPEKYQATVTVWEGRRGTKAYKEFEHENAHKDILTVTEATNVRLIADSVLNHTYAGPMIREAQQYEVPFNIEQCGIEHRGIIDAIGSWFLLDLKTTRSVKHYDLQRTIYDMKYYMQAAIYERAALLLGHDIQTYFILAVESSAPYHVQIVELEPHYIARGHLEWEKLIERWKQWDGKVQHSHDDEDGWMMDAPGYAPALDLGI